MTAQIARDLNLRVSYKQYTETTITPGSEPVPATDPAATGGQILRRVSSTLNYKRKSFESAEIRTDKQRFDARLGMGDIGGNIVGELSPKTYQDLMAAVMRSSWVAGNSKTNAQITSLAAAAAGPTFTLGGGTSFATQSFMTGDIVRPATFDATNTGKNFALVSGLTTLTATISPAPADATADTSVTLAVPGRKLIAGTTAPIIAFEHYYADTGQGKLFTECRVNTMKVSAPMGGIPTIDFGIIGRDISIPGSPPFFTSPTAVTTTTLLGPFGGQLVLAGVVVAVITAFEFTVDNQGQTVEAMFTTLPASVTEGTSKVSGQITMWLMDDTIINDLINETECEMIVQLLTANSRTADFISFFFPRVKITGHNENASGQTGIPVTVPFIALAKASGVAGYDAGSLTIIDSLSA